MAVLVVALLVGGAACDGEVARAIDAGKDLLGADQTTTDLGDTDGNVADGPATDLDKGAADKGTDAAGLCAPMDAVGVGPSCPAILGVAWNGKQCDYIGGCSCQGTDCDKLFSTMGDCKQAYLHCTSGP